MKIQIASDLHLEGTDDFDRHGARAAHRMQPPALVPAPNADLLVLAGDIHKAPHAVEVFGDWPVPVVYVMGNHEAYGDSLPRTIDALRATSTDRFRFLERDVFVHRGVRFLGTTLWTDFDLDAPAWPRDRAMAAVEDGLADYRFIDGFTTPVALAEHERSRAWLVAQLETPFDGTTVVVTHHGVHPRSVHPRWVGNPCNPGFVSDCDELLDHASLWIHGHVHDSFDYRVRGTRVVANPRGYRQPRTEAFENRRWDPRFVVDVPSAADPR